MLGIGKNMSKSMRRRTVRITALVFMLLFSETLVTKLGGGRECAD